MIIVMKQAASEEDVEKVKGKAIEQGHEPLTILVLKERLLL